MHHGTEPVLGAAIADASTEVVLGGRDMLPLMSRVVPPILLVWDAAAGETLGWEITFLGGCCCGPSLHPRAVLMGAGDALRGFAPSLLNLGSGMHPLWLQGWGFGCISVVFWVFSSFCR